MRTTSAVIPVFTAAMLLCLPIASAVAQSVQLPARNSGQWEIRMVPQTAGAPSAMSMKICVDGASGEEMMLDSLAMASDMCAPRKIERRGDAFVVEATCQNGQIKTRSRAVLSGNFQSAYTVEIISQAVGAIEAMAGTNYTRQEARWLGAECADDLSPGEMLMPGTVKMNANDMMKKMDGQ